MSTRIADLFARLKAENQPGLVAYLTAGDPSLSHTPKLVAALERGGADLIELGVPFSDPIADGPVIQRGSDRALKAGTTLKRVLEISGQIRAQSQIPILLFSYLNPLLRYGFEALARDAKAAGVDGVLMIDASVEEAGQFVPVMREAGLDTVFLAAPTSTEERLKRMARIFNRLRLSGFAHGCDRRAAVNLGVCRALDRGRAPSYGFTFGSRIRNLDARTVHIHRIAMRSGRGG